MEMARDDDEVESLDYAIEASRTHDVYFLQMLSVLHLEAPIVPFHAHRPSQRRGHMHEQIRGRAAIARTRLEESDRLTSRGEARGHHASRRSSADDEVVGDGDG